MPNQEGLLVVLSGPSGAGKDTVLRELLRLDQNVMLSISATTRAPREGEEDGKDYFFLSKAEFIQMLSKNDMLEHAEYCGHYYGTPRGPVEEWQKKGRDVILEIEVQGGQQIRQSCPNAVSIFILPPSLKVLADRLRRRNTEEEDVVCQRLETAKQEILQAVHYDYIVINDDLAECVQEIKAILLAEKMKSARRSHMIQEVLENA
ncbi:MAG TPA: guanylate kinase [Candidatus Gallacutalibacter stercoravium]|nr:guanylate kinase [Candidatus Gallacutalibacter stercoravium]